MSYSDRDTNVKTLSSFDGYIVQEVDYEVPDRYRMVDIGPGMRFRIARGGGYSYAAASFGAHSLVQDMTRFDRILRFSPDENVVQVEAGATIGSLLQFLIGKGFSLSALPGYPAITVGGCIASDVHGKNPLREGTFRRSVVGLTLFHPQYGTREIDRTSGRSFELTCGGYGLTGVILTATLRIEPLTGHQAVLTRTPVADLQEGIAILRAVARRHAVAYSWHDAVPERRSFGRGIVYTAEISPGAPCSLRRPHHYRRLTANSRRLLPLCLWTGLARRSVNAAFWHLESTRLRPAAIGLLDVLFPFSKRTAYFRLYGRPGLAEYQVLVPFDRAVEFAAHLGNLVVRAKPPTFMMSLKLFGGSQEFLRFDGEGVCFTVDMVRSASTGAFLSALDDLTMAFEGVPNIVKDSRLPVGVVSGCYPGYGTFRDWLHQYDPKRLFRSELSERLRL